MKKTLLTASLILISSFAFSQSTAKSGLDKLKANLDNAKANLEEYKNNLKIVSANIVEVNKAKSQVEEQKKQVAAQLKDNSSSLTKIQKSEAEVQKLIKTEETQILADDKKIKDLQAMIAKLEENKLKRNTNLESYKVQLTQATEERKVWEQRAAALKEQEKQVAERLKTVNAQEKEWKNKKVGYDGEVSRWSKEIVKQEKIFKQFNDLAEAKK